MYKKNLCQLSQLVDCHQYLCYFQLGPNATIGKNAVVGEGVRVRDSVVLEGAVLQVTDRTLVSQFSNILYILEDHTMPITICSLLGTYKSRFKPQQFYC